MPAIQPTAGRTVRKVRAVVHAFEGGSLTNLTVSVDSQVPGGTASTFDCDGVTGSSGAGGDGSLTRNDLEPGTYTCTIVIDP